MRRTQSLNCLHFESSKQECAKLRRSKSLDNIKLSITTSWFKKQNVNKLTRSQSISSLHNAKNSNLINKSSFTSSDSQMKQLINCKLIDDHNLPTLISDDLFNLLMRFEKNRIRTFKNWPVSFVTPLDLSKAGFYYLLNNDLVRCFECKITLFNWELGDLPILEHYKNNPKCELLNGYNVGNVQIDKTPLDLLREHIDLEEFHPIQSSENVIFEFDDDYDSDDLELDNNGLIFDRDNHRDKAALQQEQQNEQTFNEDLLFELMKNEEKRLKTFDTWPECLIDKVKPIDLAQCGYFYTTIKDKVICAFCKVPAWDWASTDVPIKEHYRHNPDCPLLNDQECGNQPIKNVKFKELLLEYQDIAPNSFSDEDVSFLQFSNFSRQLSNNSSSSGNEQSSNHDEQIDLNELNKLKNLSKVILTHKHVDKFYTYQNRLSTFEKWPTDNLNKNLLADAGFYYLGFNDQVKCFSCDLVLSKWSSTDNPWIEHCKYSCNCEYLKLVKGNDFITRNSKIKNSPKIEVVCSGSTAASSASSSSSSSSDIENEGLINFEEESFKNVCKICMIKEADVVYLPCSHLASCASCTIAMKDCPLCKQKILSTMKIYIG